MDRNELVTIAQRLREYAGNPHHVDPMSDAFKALIGDAANALSQSAQPRGEPVARITLQQVLKAYDYANCHPHKYLRGTTNWCAAVAHSLNAEQPTPVAVVMPEREMHCQYLRGVIPDNRLEVEAHKDGWNACIDELKRLNPSL